MSRRLVLIISFLSFTGCSHQAKEEQAAAPNLDFECSFVQALGCDSSNAGKTVYFGLIQDLNVTCSKRFALISGQQLTTQFDYSSHTQTSDLGGGVLTGTAAHWVNWGSMPVFNLPAVKFRVCAFIDINGNGKIDVNEPMHDSTLTVGEDFTPLSNWSNY